MDYDLFVWHISSLSELIADNTGMIQQLICAWRDYASLVCASQDSIFLRKLYQLR